MRVIGIDPGTLHLGFGVVHVPTPTGRIDYVSCGVIHLPPKLPIPERLRRIKQDLDKLFGKYSPDVMGLENVFVGMNVRSAIRIGEARATAMLAAAELQIPVHEITPATVKKLVAGNGRAAKLQIQKMVTLLLELNRAPASPDAADALAIAIATAYRLRSAGRIL